MFRKIKFIYKSQNDAYEDFKKNVARFKSYDDFFRYHEKEFNFVGDRLFKKISKLYSLLDSDKDGARQAAINEFKVKNT
jgi:hypothetical protein